CAIFLFQSAVAPPLFALALANPLGPTSFNPATRPLCARPTDAPQAARRSRKPPVASGLTVMSASNSGPACRVRPATAGQSLRPSLSAWTMAQNRAAIFACPPANPEWINTAGEVYGDSAASHQNVSREAFWCD